MFIKQSKTMRTIYFTSVQLQLIISVPAFFHAIDALVYNKNELAIACGILTLLCVVNYIIGYKIDESGIFPK